MSTTTSPPPPLVHGSIVFHETSPWCLKCLGLQLKMIWFHGVYYLKKARENEGYFQLLMLGDCAFPFLVWEAEGKLLKTSETSRNFCWFLRSVLKSCLTLQPRGCSPPGTSVYGVSQATILEWVVISSSRGSSRPGVQSCLLHWQGFFFFFIPLSHQGNPCWFNLI